MNPQPSLGGGDDASLPPHTSRSLLRMSVGSELLAVPIDAVAEVLQAPRLTPLPRTPAFMRGVMNLRGAVVPVVDLAVRLADDPTAKASLISRRSCVVVVRLDESTEADAATTPDAEPSGPVVIGLMVDAVHEVFAADVADIDTVPPLGTPVAAHYLAGILRTRTQLISLLNLARVLSARELSGLLAADSRH